MYDFLNYDEIVKADVVFHYYEHNVMTTYLFKK